MLNHKRSIGMLLSVLVMVIMVGCGQESGGSADPIQASNNSTPRLPIDPPALEDPLVAEEGTRLTVLNVEGMTCSSCARSIRGKVATLDGVEKVSVSVKDKKAWIQVQEPSDVDAQAIVEAIKAIGFQASVAEPEAVEPETSDS